MNRDQHSKKEHPSKATQPSKHHPISEQADRLPLQHMFHASEGAMGHTSDQSVPSPPDLMQYALNGDDCLVRNWLVQSNNDGLIPTSQTTSQGGYQEPNQTRQRLQQAFDISTPHAGKKRQRPSYSDSPVLEPAPRPKAPVRVMKEVELANKQREENSSRPQKRHKAEQSAIVQSVKSASQKETFERRARHKTREDRYELKKENHRGYNADVEMKHTRKQREKSGYKMNVARKDAENLMNNFHSEKIGEGRLTLRASYGPGIFGNGRTSLLARPQGVPDLAFSNMNFLRHAPRPQQQPTIEFEKVSKKEGKRKRDDAQDETSAFLDLARVPLKKSCSNTRLGRSSTQISDAVPDNADFGRKDKNKLVSYDCQEIPTMPFNHLNQDPNRYSTPNLVLVSTTQSIFFADPTSGWSASDDSYMTWSDTQVSPGAVDIANRLKRLIVREASSTPDHVRRSIEETGIFKDTGIQLGPEGGFSRKSTLPVDEQELSQQNFHKHNALTRQLHTSCRNISSRQSTRSEEGIAETGISISRNHNHRSGLLTGHDIDTRSSAGPLLQGVSSDNMPGTSPDSDILFDGPEPPPPSWNVQPCGDSTLTARSTQSNSMSQIRIPTKYIHEPLPVMKPWIRGVFNPAAYKKHVFPVIDTESHWIKQMRLAPSPVKPELPRLLIEPSEFRGHNLPANDDHELQKYPVAYEEAIRYGQNQIGNMHIFQNDVEVQGAGDHGFINVGQLGGMGIDHFIPHPGPEFWRGGPRRR